MESCYEEPTVEDVFTTEEAQTRSQSQQKGQYPQGNWLQYQKQQNIGQKSIQETRTRLDTTKATSPNISKGPSNSIKGTNLTINWDIRARDMFKVRKHISLG